MRYLILLFTISFSFQAFSQLTSTEKRILKCVDKHEEEAQELLKKVVNINSGTMNFDGVKQVGEIFIREFEEIGLDATWVDGSEWNRAGHVIAKTQGTKSPGLLLIGHLDTVFEPSSPFQSYVMLNDSTMQGPGVADMKGGDVIIVLVLKARKEAGVLDQMAIEVVLTGDEEKSGRPIEKSKQHLVEAAKGADIALGFENGDGNPQTVVISRRGSAGWMVETTGNAAHSSQLFSDKVGAGAIYELSRILNGFYNELQEEVNLTFNPGYMVGGTEVETSPTLAQGSASGKSNVVAQTAIVHGDIRAMDLQQLERAKEKMKSIVSQNLPGTTAEITFKPGGYPPLGATEGNRKLLAKYNEVSQDLGFGEVTAVDPLKAGAADVSFTSGYVDMALDGLGMSGADDHSIRETGIISNLPIQAKRAAILMYRLVYQKR